jgi:hypothetical protein
MDSFLTKYLKSKSTIISDYLNKKISFLKPYHIITASLIFHACALMNLFNYEYPVFVFLFFTSYFCTILAKITADKYNNKFEYTEYYHNVSQWIIIISLYSVFTGLYKHKINNLTIILVIVLLLLCNINYILHNYNYDNKCIELWSNCLMKFNNKNNVIYLQHFTKYFDDSLVIIYLIIIMTYLYYKKN